MKGECFPLCLPASLCKSSWEMGSLNPGVTHVSSSYGEGPSGIQYLVLGICLVKRGGLSVGQVQRRVSKTAGRMESFPLAEN